MKEDNSPLSTATPVSPERPQTMRIAENFGLIELAGMAIFCLIMALIVSFLRG